MSERPYSRAWEGLLAATAWLQPGVRATPPQSTRRAPAVSDSLPAPPECPPWLDPGEYEGLLELRQMLTSPESAA